jgi:hypothetical protein
VCFAGFCRTARAWQGLAGALVELWARFHLADRQEIGMFNVRVFLQTMITLASASLGLVAALAWNEAIRATIKKVFGEGESLPALYAYAIIATIIAIAVLTALGKAAARVGGEAVINREAEG